MVTASHNPPADNGYKVYVDDGAQIVPPMDAEIAAAIDAARRPSTVPSTAAEGAIVDVREAYVEYVADAPGSASPARDAPDRLHPDARRRPAIVRRGAGAPAFADVHVVATQAEPDPDFPTVAFPNPEEPGAMDALLALARRVRRRPRARQRPRRRPARRRRPRPAAGRRLAGAHRRRDRRAARRLPARAGRTGRDRLVATTIVVVAAVEARRRAPAAATPRRSPASSGWPAPRSPSPAPAGLRLRGGARLLRRQRGARQGRDLGGAGLRRAGGHRAGPRAGRCSTGSTTSTGATACTRPAASIRYDGPDAWTGPRRSSTGWRRIAAGRARRRPPVLDVDDLRPGVGNLPPSDVVRPPPRRRPRDRPPVGHRAEAQGLHRGRRAGHRRLPSGANRAKAGPSPSSTSGRSPRPSRAGRSAAGPTHAVPKRRSPASPRPGTMKAWSLRWSSMAAVTTWTSSPAW